MSPTPSQGIATLNIRVTELEKDVQLVQGQLQTYVSQRENEIQLKNIEQALSRIEKDQKTSNDKIDKVNETIGGALKWGVGVFASIFVIVIGGIILYYLTRP